MGWVIPAAAAAAVYYFTTRGAAAKGGATMGVGAVPLVEYLERIHAAAVERLAALREEWTTERLAQAVEAAAAAADVPAAWVWAIMYGESGLKPVGIHGGAVAKAAAANSTAYGMTQITRSRWADEERAGNTATVGRNHSNLLDPQVAAQVTAQSLARLARKRGGASHVTPEDIGAWWAGAGNAAGIARKARHVRAVSKLAAASGRLPTAAELKGRK